MYRENLYPRINLRSKTDIAKRLSSSSDYKKTLSLINQALKNKDSYWHDSKESEPKKGKYVRSAVGTPLDTVIKLIDQRILRPFDTKVPGFIYGGLKNRNHIQAASSLRGKRRKRSLIKLDIKSFFEQIQKQRVFYFLYKKCNCKKEASQLIANICCVPLGPKGSKSEIETIARGFATSPRLSLWCNLETFLKLQTTVKRKLKGYDPEIAIFVDDIGVTASDATMDKLEEVKILLSKILKEYDPNQPLPLNEKKSSITSYKTRIEHLGINIGRKKLDLGRKSRSKRDKLRKKLQGISNSKKDLQRYRAYKGYRSRLQSELTDKVYISK